MMCRLLSDTVFKSLQQMYLAVFAQDLRAEIVNTGWRMAAPSCTPFRGLLMNP